MDDAGRHLDVVHRRQFALGAEEDFHEPLHRQDAVVEMNLQRADAGGEVDEAGDRVAFEPGEQRVGALTQGDVELERAVFDQNVGIAGPAVNDCGRGGSGRDRVKDGGLGRLDFRFQI